MHVRAVVRAINPSAPTSAVPRERVVAVIRVVHQITSVEMAGSVVSIRVIYFRRQVRLARRRPLTIVCLEVRPAVASVVLPDWSAVVFSMGNQIAGRPASVKWVKVSPSST
jgi:hypothetical protein